MLDKQTKRKARMLLQNREILSAWEVDFLKTCLRLRKTTSAQDFRFHAIIAKHHKTAPPEREQSPLKRTDTIKMRFTRDEILKGKALRSKSAKHEKTLAIDAENSENEAKTEL